jgi:hypothetical protein
MITTIFIYGIWQGGGWCNDLPSCLERAQTRRGSTRYMTKWEVFSGILSNNATLNPGKSRFAFLFFSLLMAILQIKQWL